MNRPMTRALVSAALLAAVVSSVPAASAAPGDTIHGGCGYIPDGNLTVPAGTQEGVIYDVSTTQNASGSPIQAVVHCWIDVNGVYQAGTDLYTPPSDVQENSTRINFKAWPTDTVTECEEVQFGTDLSWTFEGCPGVTTIEIPPQAVVDLINNVINSLGDLPSQFVDPILCPILGSLAGNYGPITIDPTGDVYWGKLIYDCPPY